MRHITIVIALPSLEDLYLFGTSNKVQILLTPPFETVIGTFFELIELCMNSIRN